MRNVRKYGYAPFSLAVIHGGPGAAGEMRLVVKTLSQSRGVLEPLQTAKTIKGQILELNEIIRNQADTPLTLIGHSWGAWLTMIYAAHYPTLVKKIIFVGSGPFEEKYVPQITQIRMNRLNDVEKGKLGTLVKALNDPHGKRKDDIFAQIGTIFFHTDSYKPLKNMELKMNVEYRIFQHIWEEADEMRRRGKLLDFAKKLQCPVVAIHGDYDPHPFEGVKKPLSKILKDFTFILLKNCGHYPWVERYAREKFYAVLEKELWS